MLNLVAVQELSLGIDLGFGVRLVQGTWVGVMGEHAGGVREHDHRSWGQAAPASVREGWIKPFPSTAGCGDQGSVGMRTAGSVREG